MADFSPANLTAQILQDLPPHDPGVPAPHSTNSYWHQAPTPLLYNHRSTPTLPSSAKTVIIGSGLAGTLCFESLSSSLTPDQLGDVVMLEARSTCWGATGRNGGHCRPALYQYGLFLEYVKVWGEEAAIKLARYERRNLELMLEYGKRYKETEFTDTDGADVYYEAPSWEVVKACVAKVTELDAEVGAQLRIVEGATVEGRKELDEVLRVPTAVGAVMHRCAKLWPFRLVEGILGDEIGKGVLNLQCQTAATTLRKADGEWVVKTERGDIKAERVVVAANAHTAHLIPVLRGCIYPVRAQMAALSPPTSMKDKPLKHTYALIRNVFEHSEYMIQRPAPGFQILIGGARQFEENEGVLLQDGSISQKVSNYLRRAISGYFPNETGYPDDMSLESAPKLRESFMDRFSKLQISAGLDAWDAAEGAGMFMSSSFHQQPPPKSQPAASSFPPPAKELHAEQEWSGTMGYSRDEHPFVGRIPVIGKAAAGRLEIPEMNDTKGLWVCAGFQGHGMAFVSGSAKVLGGMIARDEAEGSRDAEAWKKVEDWFPETFIITPERLRLNLGKDGMEMEESENDWVIVNGYQAEVDKE